MLLSLVLNMHYVTFEVNGKYCPKGINTANPYGIYVQADLTNVTERHCVTLISIPSNRIAVSNYSLNEME